MKAQHLGDLGRAAILIAIAQRDLLPGAQRAAADAADADAADVRVVVERRDLQLQRARRARCGGGHVLQHRFKQRSHVRVAAACGPVLAQPCSAEA